MDERIIRQIQREGAEALLDAGVSLPLAALKFPFRKERVRLRVTMRRPTLAVQLRIARTWLSMETPLERFRQMTFDEQAAWLVEHGRKLSRIIALTLDCRWLPTCVLSWAVRHWMGHGYQLAAIDKFVSLMGTEGFMPIISSVDRANPMKLRLSHGKRGS